MVTTLESWAQALASKTNQLYGKVSVIYEQITEGAYDPAAGAPAQTIVDYPLAGHPAIIGEITQFAERFVGQGSIIQGDAQLKIAAADLVAAGMTGDPKANDRVTCDGAKYTVIEPTRIYAGGTVSEFWLHIR